MIVCQLNEHGCTRLLKWQETRGLKKGSAMMQKTFINGDYAGMKTADWQI